MGEEREGKGRRSVSFETSRVPNRLELWSWAGFLHGRIKKYSFIKDERESTLCRYVNEEVQNEKTKGLNPEEERRKRLERKGGRVRRVFWR